MIRQRIEFMIAHDRERTSGLMHGTDQPDGFWYLRPTIHEIADEDGRSRRMPKCSVTLFVSKPIQQVDQLVCMSVNITNDVVQTDLPFTR